MEKETKHYVEYINHDTNWFKTITIEIDKFPINREYVDFFMQIYIQWNKDDGLLHLSENSSFHVCLLLRNWLCHNSSYILKRKQCFSVLCAVLFKRLFSFDLIKVNKSFFVLLHMLRIHTVFRTLSRRNVYDLYLLKMNPFDIGKPWIKIEKIGLLFENI